MAQLASASSVTRRGSARGALLGADLFSASCRELPRVAIWIWEHQQLHTFCHAAAWHGLFGLWANPRDFRKKQRVGPSVAAWTPGSILVRAVELRPLHGAMPNEVYLRRQCRVFAF